MLRRLDPVAARDAVRAFLWSRLLVMAAAALGAIAFAPAATSLHAKRSLVHPFGDWPAGGVVDFVLSPLVRFDAHWYLEISQTGYDPAGAEGIARAGRPAFFPLYPLLIRAFGGFAGTGAAVVAAYLISAAALLCALYVLHRLVTLDLGVETARATVLLVAFCPVAYFFSAPYTESLFLLESAAALYAARTGRWAAAGAIGALASGTRNVGVVLLVPLAILYLYRDRPTATVGELLRRPRPAPPGRSILWLGLAPAGLAAFSLYLRGTVGDAQAWRRAQVFFGHDATVFPLEGIRRGAVSAFHAVEGTVPTDLRFPTMLEFAFLVVAVFALVGALRTLPAAYSLYSLAALVPALSSPVVDEPLRSFPRYTLVVFPLFVWLARACERRGLTAGALTASAAGLAFVTAGFASWQTLA
ncbi:MAG TPA: mannosyltransferase family protein [Thermoleophilaceae bacterium]